MRLVDQIDAKKFNALAGVLGKLDIVAAWATINTHGGSWYANDDMPITMFDERWLVVVMDHKRNIHAEYEV